MPRLEKGVVVVDMDVYVGELLSLELPGWKDYLVEMILRINIFLAAHRLPLRVNATCFCVWKFPKTCSKEYEASKILASALFQKLRGSDVDFFKTLCCCLVNRTTQRTGDVRVFFAGGLLKNKGGICLVDDTGIFSEVLVCYHGYIFRDTAIFAHELFHFIGLPHSENENSVMFGYAEKFILDEVDQALIKKYIKRFKENYK